MAERKMIYLDNAIDALTDYFSFINPIAFIDILSALPPAEPEIIHCKDCVYWNEDWNDGQRGDRNDRN